MATLTMAHPIVHLRLSPQAGDGVWAREGPKFVRGAAHAPLEMTREVTVTLPLHYRYITVTFQMTREVPHLPQLC